MLEFCIFLTFFFPERAVTQKYEDNIQMDSRFYTPYFFVWLRFSSGKWDNCTYLAYRVVIIRIKYNIR